MVTEKVFKRTQIGVGDVIEHMDTSGDIIVAGNEWNDNIPAIGTDSKILVIPHIVQISARKDHVLNIVNLG